MASVKLIGILRKLGHGEKCGRLLISPTVQWAFAFLIWSLHALLEVITDFG